MTRLLLAVSHTAAHSASIGATSVEPAPLSVGVAADATAALRPNTQPATNPAHVRLTNFLERNADFLSFGGLPSALGVARPPLASGLSIPMQIWRTVASV